MDKVSAIAGYLTVQEAADIIGVSHAQATRYIKQARLPAKKIGRTYLIAEKDARKFERPPMGNPNLLKSTA